MKALRVERANGRAHVVHWLAADGNWTICGLRVKVLLKPEYFDIVSLPLDEGCDVCPEMLNVEKGRRSQGVVLNPGAGRLRKVGPLYHGLKPRPSSWTQIPHDD
jgi:hypothetical protein